MEQIQSLIVLGHRFRIKVTKGHYEEFDKHIRSIDHASRLILNKGWLTKTEPFATPEYYFDDLQNKFLVFILGRGNDGYDYPVFFVVGNITRENSHADMLGEMIESVLKKFLNGGVCAVHAVIIGGSLDNSADFSSRDQLEQVVTRASLGYDVSVAKLPIRIYEAHTSIYYFHDERCLYVRHY